MTATINEIMGYLWAPGKHSLCAKHGGSKFQVVGYFDKYEDLLERASQMPEGSDVWWGVHGMAQPPKSGRGGVDDVTSVVAMSADFDWADEEAHKATPEPLPSEGEVRRIVAEMVPQPSIVINSGHGLQAYWVLDEEVDGDVGRMLIDGFFRYVEDRYGLSNDRVDLASILRVPGSTNNKAEPVEVVVETIGEDQWKVDWLFEHCWLPMPEPVRPAPQPATPPKKINGSASWNDDEKPSDWLNRTATRQEVGGWLSQGGWTFEKMDRTNEHWMRPGISDHHGLSLHENCSATLFTTSAPPDFKTKPGTKILTPFDIYAAVFHQGMFVKAAQDIGRNLIPKRAPASAVPMFTAEAGDEAEAAATPHLDSLNLPDEFWNARPEFAHIRQAGYSRMVSPDSVLGAVITRYATAIPPNYRIDDMIGTWGTFDHLAVLVSPTAIGKSSSMSLAERLWKGPQYKTIVWGLPKPSGEGLVDAFFEEVTEDEGGKKVRVKKKTKTAVMFSVGEAMSLIKSGMRQGATIADVLISAWSGEDPGTANASSDRKRIGMNPGTFRMSGLMAMQTELGHNFFTAELMEQGLSSRLLMHSAIDPDMPDENDMPDWPGDLDLPVLDTVPTIVEYPKEVVSYIRQFHHDKATGRAVVDPSEGHTNLVRLKLTGIFGFWAGRTNPNLEDWELAGMVVDTHKAIKDRILAHKSEADRRALVTAGTALGAKEKAAEDYKERQGIASAKQQILGILDIHGEVKKRRLKESLMWGNEKKLVSPALHSLVADGLILWTDGTVKKA